MSQNKPGKNHGNVIRKGQGIENMYKHILETVQSRNDGKDLVFSGRFSVYHLAFVLCSSIDHFVD